MFKSRIWQIKFDGVHLQAELNRLMRAMERNLPTQFERMLASRSMNTDTHILHLMYDVFGYCHAETLLWVEQAALRLAMTMWDQHFGSLQCRRPLDHAPRMTQMKFKDVLQELQFNQSVATYQEIFDAKEFLYSDWFMGITPERLSSVCCILHCKLDGMRQMNSMMYCGTGMFRHTRKIPRR